MRKSAAGEFGTAIWITSDGDRIRAENHLASLVERYFDLNKLKSRFDDFINLYSEQLDITSELTEELSYIDSLEPLQIGELKPIARQLSSITNPVTNPETNEVIDIGEEFLSIAKQCAVGGFDKVIFGNERGPYPFAFQKGDIRVRLFSDSFVVEMDGNRLNRKTAGWIIDALFSLVGNRRVPSYILELWNYGTDEFGSDAQAKNYHYGTMDEFFEGLSEQTTRRVAFPIDLLLKLASIFYKRTKEI